MSLKNGKDQTGKVNLKAGQARQDVKAHEDSSKVEARKQPLGFDKITGSLDRKTVVFGEKTDKDNQVIKKRGYGFTAAEDDHPFLQPQISIITGSTGSGKTVLALNILEEALQHVDPKRLGKVLVYTGSPSDPAIQELDDSTVQIYGPDMAQSLIDDLHSLQLEVRGIPEDERKLNFLLLDDAGSNKTLSPSQVKGSEIGEILVSHRHLSLHLVIMAQRVKGMLSPFILANFSHLFMYSNKNKGDEDELLRNIPFPEDLVKKHISTIRSQKHQFLWVDVPHRCVKVGFDDVVLS